jgi:hypothetical protein
MNPRMEGFVWASDVVFAANSLPVFAALAIVSAWATLLVARLWRAEPTWVDRAGRTVAVAWIAAGLLRTCHYLAFQFLDFSASMMIWG